MDWYWAILLIGNGMILGQTASVTLAISRLTVATAAAYLHFGQLQIHSDPSGKCGSAFRTKIYYRTTAYQWWGKVRIWSISPLDGIVTTPRPPLSSNTIACHLLPHPLVDTILR